MSFTHELTHREMTARSVRSATSMIMGGLFLVIDTDRDDMPIAERIAATAEVLAADEEGHTQGSVSGRPVLN